MERKVVLGIDIGATKTRICLGDVDGNIYAKKVYNTREVAADLASFVVHESMRLYSEFKDRGELLGIGIASIGPLDLRRGVILSPPNVPFKEVEIVKAFKEKFDVMVLLINDAVAAVWAEKQYGVGRSYENVVYVTFSTGVGAGIIVDGNLLIGKDGNAHEVGHIVVDYSGFMRCRCGGYGHWEAYCGGINIPLFVKKLLNEKYKPHILKSMLNEDYSSDNITVEKLFEYANKGDWLALKIVEDEIGRLNAAGLASIINCYDPEIILIGGGIALNNKEIVIKSINKHLDLYVTNGKPLIRITSLGEDVVLKGAIAIIAKPPHTLLNYVNRAV